MYSVNEPIRTLHRTFVEIGGGRAASDDGTLDIRFGKPKIFGGQGDLANPEQLFGAGYGACLANSISAVAAQRGLPVEGLRMWVEVAVGVSKDGYGFELSGRIRLPGLDPATADELVRRAHQICPYARATRGNVAVTFQIEVAAGPDPAPASPP